MHGPGVTISGVSGVELVGVADPFETFDVVDVVEQSEIEVAGHAEDAVDADLLYAGPEVEAEGNSVGCAVDALACVCHGRVESEGRSTSAIRLSKIDVFEKECRSKLQTSQIWDKGVDDVDQWMMHELV